MSRGFKTASFALILLVVLLAQGQALSASSLPIWVVATGREFIDVATDGEHVLWVQRDEATNQAHLQAYSLSADRHWTIRTYDNPGLISELSVDSGLATWKEGPTHGTINLYDLRSFGYILFNVPPPGKQAYAPAVRDNRVVWIEEDAHDGSRALMSWDTATRQPSATAMLESGWEAYHLALDGDWIVWGEWQRTSGSQTTLRLRSLSRATGAQTTLHEEQILVGSPAPGFDLNNGTLIYSRDKLYRTRSGERLTLPVALHQPTTNGRYVYGVHADQFVGYDLETASLFTIVPAGGNTHSNVRNNLLAWVIPGGDADQVVAIPHRGALPTQHRGAGSTQPGRIYFNETGHTLGGVFKGFWEQSGGLPVFGYPLTEEFQQRSRDTGEFYATQYLERQRYEHHPEHAGTHYEVLLGRLGVEVLLSQGRDWRTFPKSDPSAPNYVAETGHAIATQFLEYWHSHGLEFGDAGVSYRESLALFGYPISEPQIETNPDGDRVLTQWFERARFEYHPDNPAGYRVLLGRLGAEALAEHGWQQ